MITERTLRKWRKDALNVDKQVTHICLDGLTEEKTVKIINDLCDRILRMTQELLDNHLMRK